MQSHRTYPNRFVLLEHIVEPFQKRNGESDIATMQRMLGARGHTGWELVDVCGDELRMPVLVFRRMAELNESPLYLVEEVPHKNHQNEVQNVIDHLWDRLQNDWLPVCILDSLFTSPVAVLKKSKTSCRSKHVKAIPLAPEFFGRLENSITTELVDQQLRNNMTLACVMHGGLHPILIMISKDDDQPYDYLVEHASGGFFKNQTKTLSDLIQSRILEGWEVCGAFEDVFLWPCVIFRRFGYGEPGMISGPSKPLH